jgi:hypothetical protein
MGYDDKIAILSDNEVDKGAKVILDKLQDGRQLPQVDCELSFEEVKKCFRSWSEDTSTSPSGRHLGHYRCLLTPDPIDTHQDPLTTRENPDQEPSLGNRILQVYFWVMMSAIRMGTSLRRWQNS